jgi:hypothetical protein
MSTRVRAWSNAITLGISGLLGAALLAGCGAAGSHTPAASTAAASTAAGGQPVATAVAESAPGLLRTALAAPRAGGSVHINVDLSDKSAAHTYSDQYSDDATASGGRQVITVGETEHATILFLDKVGYVQANLQSLEGFFGVPRLRAEQYAGQWIALRPGQHLGQASYADVTAGITLQSVASTAFAFGGRPVLVKSSVIAGQPVDGLQAPAPAGGGLPATAKNVLYVSSGPVRRPVLLETTGAGSGYQYRMSFSDWHEALHLTAPANPVSALLVTPASTTT